MADNTNAKKDLRMLYGLKYPSPDKIASRTSTVTRAMASTLASIIDAPKENAVLLDMAALLYFGEEFKNLKKEEQDRCEELKNGKGVKCVYCGNDADELDHLFSLVGNKAPSGYVTEPINLVPCCKDCNGSKGAKPWYEYMCMDNYIKKNGEPKSKKEKIYKRLTQKDEFGGDLNSRKKHLENFCKHYHLPLVPSDNKGNYHKRNFEENSDAYKWWNDLNALIKNTLDIAQFQIESFNAGASECRSKGDLCEKCLDNLFRDYVNSILNRGDNDLLKRILNNLKITRAPDTQNKNYDEALGAFKKGYEFERGFQQNDK